MVPACASPRAGAAALGGAGAAGKGTAPNDARIAPSASYPDLAALLPQNFAQQPPPQVTWHCWTARLGGLWRRCCQTISPPWLAGMRWCALTSTNYIFVTCDASVLVHCLGEA